MRAKKLLDALPQTHFLQGTRSLLNLPDHQDWNGMSAMVFSVRMVTTAGLFVRIVMQGDLKQLADITLKH
jgi:hypothetical protein